MSHVKPDTAQAAFAGARPGEERLLDAIAGTGLGAYDMDLQSGTGVWSATAFEMLGLPAAPDGGSSIDAWRDTIHPDDRARVGAEHGAAAARGGAWRTEYRIVRPATGETRWLETFGQFIGPAGAQRSLGVVIDVTARKRAERRQAFLLGLSDRLREAASAREATETVARMLAAELRVESAGFLEIDPDRGEGWVISGYGKTADRFIHRPIQLGPERGPLRGASIADLSAGRTFVLRDVAADPRTAADAAEIERAVRAAAVIHAPLMRRDRLTAVLYVHSEPAREWTDDEIALVEDVAARTSEAVERLRAEDALMRVNAQLAEEVAAAVSAREAALLQLHHAQKLETIGQLTGGIAHDFNNLLTPITGALDILANRFTDDARLARLIGGALQSAERARMLVQRLLGFARRQPLSPVAVDIAALTDGMRDLIASSIEPTIELVYEIAPGLPTAVADPNQLELAILNLCVNARDAMPKGGTLTISATAATAPAEGAPDLAPGDYVRLAVADTGSGMDEETRRRAVEPFFSTKSSARGTGLGLSMVHGLAGQLGGGLAIWSAPGQGTRVELWLPVAAPTAARATTSPGAAPCEVAPLRLLLVDDEPLVRIGTAEMLRELGHQVAEAASAREALALLARGDPVDAVITDYMMPDIDGIELARRIDGVRPGLKVLLVTGYMAIDDVRTPLPRLAKPFGRGELSKALAQLADTPR